MYFAQGFVSKHENTGPSTTIPHLPNTSYCAADLIFHRCLLVLGVCQLTKVRRQLLWSIGTEHKGKAMIMTVMMMIDDDADDDDDDDDDGDGDGDDDDDDDDDEDGDGDDDDDDDVVKVLFLPGFCVEAR